MTDTTERTTGAMDARTEQLTEWIYDALAGFYDFGESGRDAEDTARWDTAKHIAARFNKHVRFLGSDDVDAIRHIASFLDGDKAPEQIGCAVWDVADTIKRIAEVPK